MSTLKCSRLILQWLEQGCPFTRAHTKSLYELIVCCLEIDADLYNVLAHRYPVLPCRLLSNRQQLTPSTGHGVTALCTKDGECAQSWKMPSPHHLCMGTTGISLYRELEPCYKSMSPNIKLCCKHQSLFAFKPHASPSSWLFANMHGWKRLVCCMSRLLACASHTVPECCRHLAFSAFVLKPGGNHHWISISTKTQGLNWSLQGYASIYSSIPFFYPLK